MADVTRYAIGSTVTCTDGPGGEITQVVVEPVRREVTHLVVEPKHRLGLGRLVPLTLVAKVDAGRGEVTLSCTTADFEHLDQAEEERFLPEVDGWLGYNPGQVYAWPHYGLSPPTLPLPTVEDTLPPGEVAIFRGDHVRATDGDIGEVKGLAIDATTNRVTHVLLAEGHLWGRKEVAIPIAEVTSVEGGIEVRLTKGQIQDLPPVEVAAPDLAG